MNQRMNPNMLSSYATTVSFGGNYTVVTYQSTQIVRFNSEEVLLNSGGFLSSTTKRKMNQASNQFHLGYQVYQEDFTWYVVFKGETKLFNDGMILKR